MPVRLDASTLRAWLGDGGEMALLDAREEGVYFREHLFHAVCVPLSRLELLIGRLVPRRDTRVVWCDDGGSGLAQRAAARSEQVGWTDVYVLDGGTGAWAAAGGELYAGVNVPSKAFGEFVEHTYGTPRIGARELAALLEAAPSSGPGSDQPAGKESGRKEAQRKVVVLDSRPLTEYRRMSIPTGIDCPGAELVHRVKEVVTDPDTLVVVNCAGRTRSIIGAQSLINAGLENPVVALENGTMGWHLAGLEVAGGASSYAPDPSPASSAWAQRAASSVRERFGVETIDATALAAWLADPTRTTYVLDVRSPEEFVGAHRAGSRSAPGGQLVQATDEYAATRNARLVLVDDDSVRASMTASWLRQMGWDDAVVLADGLAGCALEAGDVVDAPLRPQTQAGGDGSATALPHADEISAAELGALLATAGPQGPDGAAAPGTAASAGEEPGAPRQVAVIDLATSLYYRRRGHVPGAWWAVRSRLAEAREMIGEPSTIVVTSEDGVLARLAAADVAATWPDADVRVLRGGTRAWIGGGGEIETGFVAPTTTPDDVWYKPYDHDDGVPEQHMQDYLTWEVGLVAQLARDPSVSFKVWPAAPAT